MRCRSTSKAPPADAYDSPDRRRLHTVLPLIATFWAWEEAFEPSFERVIRFSGYEWLVKASNGLVGPGPYYFSDTSESVWVDENGWLHLKVREEAGRWLASEIVSVDSFGYGEYAFEVDGAATDIDRNVVLGFFTWSDDIAFAHREIDIEISRWMDPAGLNGQCVVQPYHVPGAVVRFDLPTAETMLDLRFAWSRDSVLCTAATPGRPKLFEHRYTSGIPQAGGENARINLWLVAGRPPANGAPVEVIVKRFDFESE
jgi:hypothetical protein